MNPIKETWNSLGTLVWRRSTFGGWKKRALNLEGEANSLRKQLAQADRLYALGWKDGFNEAIAMAQIDVSFKSVWTDDK